MRPMSDIGPLGGDEPDPLAQMAAAMEQFFRMAGSGGGPGSTNWDAARQMAAAVASQGRSEPNVDPMARMQLEQLVRVAELQVADVTGLTSAEELRATALTRGQWAARTVDDYRPIFEQLADSLGRLVTSQLQQLDPEDLRDVGGLAGGIPGFDLSAMMSGLGGLVGPAMTVAMAGSVVGQLASRAFGSYDLPIPRPAGGELAVILDGLDEFGRDWSLPTDDLRLWWCLHEAAHHLVLTQPAVQRRLSSLLADHAGAFEADPAALEAELGPIDPDEPEGLEQLQDLLANPDRLLGTLRSPRQRELMARIDAVVAAVEGYVDWVLDQVGERLLASAPMVAEAMRRRRVEADAGTRFVERIFGLELTQEKIDRGEAFVAAVADAHGRDGLAVLWTHPEGLPTPVELDEPLLWMARVGLSADEPLPELDEDLEIPDYPELD